MDNSDHNDNPVDHPAAWIRDETLTDVALDDVTITRAGVEMMVDVFARSCRAYADAVAKQDPRLAASDFKSMAITRTPWVDAPAYRDGKPRPEMLRRLQPQTIAICNGPAYTVALVVRHNRLDVVDIGNAG